MKASAADLKRLLRDPDFGFALFYGPDHGLVRERADALAARIVEDIHDPFRTVDLSGAALKRDPARLADEAAALSFTGGRRLVRVEDADDDVARLLARLSPMRIRGRPERTPSSSSRRASCGRDRNSGACSRARRPRPPSAAMRMTPRRSSS